MTEQDEKLLLNDICARIPYEVIGTVEHYDEITKEPANLLGVLWGIDGHNRVQFAYLPEYTDEQGAYNYFDFRLFKPYLRPMSSMTDEEMIDFLQVPDLSHVSKKFIGDFKRGNFGIMTNMSKYARNIDWLNKNMFDYRGLIEKGLAIAITENNNPYKN